MATQNNGEQGYYILEGYYTDDNSLDGLIMPNIYMISPEAIVPDGTTITYNQPADVTPTGGANGDIWYNEPSDTLFKNVGGVWSPLTDRVVNAYYQGTVANPTACPIPVPVTFTWANNELESPMVDINLHIDRNGTSQVVENNNNTGSFTAYVGDTITVHQQSDTVVLPWPTTNSSARMQVMQVGVGTPVYDSTVTTQSGSFNSFTFTVSDANYTVTSSSASTSTDYTNAFVFVNNALAPGDGNLTAQIFDLTDSTIRTKRNPPPEGSTSPVDTSTNFNTQHDANLLRLELVSTADKPVSALVTQPGTSYNITQTVAIGATVEFTGLTKGFDIHLTLS